MQVPGWLRFGAGTYDSLRTTMLHLHSGLPI